MSVEDDLRQAEAALAISRSRGQSGGVPAMEASPGVEAGSDVPEATVGPMPGGGVGLPGPFDTGSYTPVGGGSGAYGVGGGLPGPVEPPVQAARPPTMPQESSGISESAGVAPAAESPTAGQPSPAAGDIGGVPDTPVVVGPDLGVRTSEGDPIYGPDGLPAKAIPGRKAAESPKIYPDHEGIYRDEVGRAVQPQALQSDYGLVEPWVQTGRDRQDWLNRQIAAANRSMTHVEQLAAGVAPATTADLAGNVLSRWGAGVISMGRGVAQTALETTKGGGLAAAGPFGPIMAVQNFAMTKMAPEFSKQRDALIEQLKRPSKSEENVAAESQAILESNLKETGLGPAIAADLAGNLSTEFFNTALVLMLAGSGGHAPAIRSMKDLTVLKQIKGMLPSATRFAGFTYGTTPGEDADRAKAAAHSFVFMISPAVTSGVSSDLVAKILSTAINEALTTEAFAQAWVDAKMLASQRGGTPWQWMVATATPALLMGILFGSQSKSMAKMRGAFIDAAAKAGHPGVADWAIQEKLPRTAPKEQTLGHLKAEAVKEKNVTGAERPAGQTQAVKRTAPEGALKQPAKEPAPVTTEKKSKPAAKPELTEKEQESLVEGVEKERGLTDEKERSRIERDIADAIYRGAIENSRGPETFYSRANERWNSPQVRGERGRDFRSLVDGEGGGDAWGLRIEPAEWFGQTGEGRWFITQAARYDAEVTFVTGMPEGRGCILVGNRVYLDARSGIDRRGYFHHELCHLQETNPDSPIRTAMEYVDLKSETAKKFIENYNRDTKRTWSDDVYRGEIIAELASGAPEQYGLKLLDAVTDPELVAVMIQQHYRRAPEVEVPAVAGERKLADEIVDRGAEADRRAEERYRQAKEEGFGTEAARQAAAGAKKGAFMPPKTEVGEGQDELIGVSETAAGSTRFAAAGVRALERLPVDELDVVMQDYVTAEQMAMQGGMPDGRLRDRDMVLNEKIRRATGFYKGIDGLWRFQVDDSKAKVDLKLAREIDENNRAVRLHELMDHPELFKLYPKLKSIRVYVEGERSSSYYPARHTIALGRIYLRSSDALRRAVFHEVMHAIQEYEGFGRGTTPMEYMTKPDRKIWFDRFLYGKDVKFSGPMVWGYPKYAVDKYKRTAGEMEAEGEARRHGLPPRIRKMWNPLREQLDAGEIRKVEKAIVRFAPGTEQRERRMAVLEVDRVAAWRRAAMDVYSSNRLLGNIGVREVLQNSLDAVLKALQNGEVSEGTIDITAHGDSGFTAKDNGIGMSDADIADKFLVLHKSGKNEAGQFGGKGIAKAVILLPTEDSTFKVHTRDNYFDDAIVRESGQIKAAPMIQGTEITVASGAGQEILSSDAKRYVELTVPPDNVKLTFNGIAVKSPFSGLVSEEHAGSSDMGKNKWTINYYHTPPTGYKGVEVIRLVDERTGAKLIQAVRQVGGSGFGGAVVIDITTKYNPQDENYPLTASREDLRWTTTIKKEVSEIVEKKTIDKLSGGRQATAVRDVWSTVKADPDWSKGARAVEGDPTYQQVVEIIQDMAVEDPALFGFRAAGQQAAAEAPVGMLTEIKRMFPYEYKAISLRPGSWNQAQGHVPPKNWTILLSEDRSSLLFSGPDNRIMTFSELAAGSKKGVLGTRIPGSVIEAARVINDYYTRYGRTVRPSFVRSFEDIQILFPSDMRYIARYRLVPDVVSEGGESVVKFIVQETDESRGKPVLGPANPEPIVTLDEIQSRYPFRVYNSAKRIARGVKKPRVVKKVASVQQVYAGASVVTDPERLRIKTAYNYKGFRGGDPTHFKLIAMFEAVGRMYSTATGYGLRSVYVLLEQSTNAEYSKQNVTCGFNPLNYPLDAFKNPHALAGTISRLLEHELTHAIRDYHDESYSSQREATGRRVAHLYPYVLGIAEAVMDQTAKQAAKEPKAKQLARAKQSMSEQQLEFNVINERKREVDNGTTARDVVGADQAPTGGGGVGTGGGEGGGAGRVGDGGDAGVRSAVERPTSGGGPERAREGVGPGGEVARFAVSRRDQYPRTPTFLSNLRRYVDGYAEKSLEMTEDAAWLDRSGKWLNVLQHADVIPFETAGFGDEVGSDDMLRAGYVRVSKYRKEIGIEHAGMTSEQRAAVEHEIAKNDLKAEYEDRRGTLSRFAGSRVPLWKSRMREVLEKKLPGTMAGPQLVSLLDGWMKKGEFKKAELEESGLGAWAKGQGRVSKADVLAELDRTEVDLVEVVKAEGAAEAFKDWTEDQIREHLIETMGADDSGLERMSRQELIRWAEENVDPYEAADARGDGDTKFAEYQLPGGTNYREILVTVPAEKPTVPEIASMRMREDGMWEALDSKGENLWTESFKNQWGPSESQARSAAENWLEAQNKPDSWLGGHWSEPNVIVHARVNDRTTPDGKRMLFVEEFQSDLHQKGREKGYDVPRYTEDDIAKFRVEKLPEGEYTAFIVRDADGTIIAQPPHFAAKNEQEALDIAVKAAREGHEFGSMGRVPNLPMKGEAWKRLIMARVLRMAAEEGYDAVGWTTGLQQVQRYESAMRQQVDAVSWNPAQRAGNRHVLVEKNGVMVVSFEVTPDGTVARDTGMGATTISGKPLTEVLGKGLAARIMEEPEGKATGPDLTVGGEGMKGFYDREMVNIANDLVGKLDKGVRVGETNLGGNKLLPDDAAVHVRVMEILKHERMVQGEFGEALDLVYKQMLNQGDSFSEAVNFMAEETSQTWVGSVRELVNQRLNDGGDVAVTVHSVPITDTMRQKLLAEPQYRYAGERPRNYMERLEEERTKFLASRKELGSALRRARKKQLLGAAKEETIGSDIGRAVLEEGGIRAYKVDPATITPANPKGTVPWAEEMRSVPLVYKRKDGQALDRMLEAVVAKGLLPDTATESDLIDALAGKHVRISEAAYFRGMAPVVPEEAMTPGQLSRRAQNAAKQIGKIETTAKFKARMQEDREVAKAKLKVEREVLAENTGRDVEDIRVTLPALVAQAYELGREKGVVQGRQAITPVETTLRQVMAARDRRLKLTSKERRLSQNMADLQMVQNVLDGIEMDNPDSIDMSRRALDGMFGDRAALAMRRATQGNVAKTFLLIRNALEGYLRDQMADEIVRSLGMKDVRTRNLVPEALEAFEDLLGDYETFPRDVIDKMQEQMNRGPLEERLAEEALTTPEQEAKAQRVAEGYRLGIANYLAGRPFGEVRDFHGRLMEVVAYNRNAKHGIAAGRRQRREEIASVMKDEMRETEPVFAPGESRTGGRPLGQGKLVDLNTNARTVPLILTGWKDGTVTEDVLAAAPFRGEDAAALAVHDRRSAFLDFVASAINPEHVTRMATPWNQINPRYWKERHGALATLVKWASDEHPVSFVDGEQSKVIVFTTRELMDIWNMIKDVQTVKEFARAGLNSINNRGQPELGVRFVDEVDAYNQLRQAVEQNLTPEQRAVADYMHEDLNDPAFREELNAVSRSILGVNLYTNPSYWPRSRDRLTSKVPMTVDDLSQLVGQMTPSIEHPGFSKKRVTTTADVLYSDGVDKYMRHIEESGRYVHLTAPLAESVNALRASYGDVTARVGQEGFRRLLETYYSMAGAERPETPGGMWFRRNAAVAILWYRASALFKNIWGQRAAAPWWLWAHVSPEVAGRFVADPVGLAPSKTFWLIKANRDAFTDLVGTSGYLANRWMDQPVSVYTSQLGARDPETKRVMGLIWKEVQQFGMMPHSETEAKPTLRAYLAMLDSGMSKEDATAAVVNMLRHIQNPSSDMDTTTVYRASRQNFLLWMLNPFPGPTSVIANTMQEAVGRFRNAEGADRSAARRGLIAAIGLGLSQAIVTGMISQLLWQIKSRNVNKSDEDKAKEKARAIVDTAGNALDTMVLPGAGQISQLAYDALQSPNYQSPDMVGKAIESLVKGVPPLMKSFDDRPWTDAEEKALLRAAEGAAQMIGAPAVSWAIDVDKLIEGESGKRSRSRGGSVDVSL